MTNTALDVTDELTLDTEASPLRQLSAPPRGDPFLIVLNDGAVVPYVVRVSKKSTVVGRGKSIDLLVTDGGVSSRHCELTLGPEHLVTLKDLDSTNGTYVNGKAVKERVLMDGDRVEIGHRVVLLLAYQEALSTRYSIAVKELANRDPHTRIFSRRVLIDQLRMEFIYSKRSRLPLSLCVADVDELARLNETHGRNAGDAALVAVSKTIRSQLRPSDFVVRYGGEEFGVVMRDCDARMAMAMGEKIRNAVEKLSTSVLGSSHEMACVSTTICAGIATLTEDEYERPDQLVEAAESGLTTAKRSGRNRVITLSRRLEAPA